MCRDAASGPGFCSHEPHSCASPERTQPPPRGWDPYPYSAASLNGKNLFSRAWLTPLPSPINKTSEPNWVSFYWLHWLLAEGPLLGPSWRGPGTNEITENHKSVLWPQCSHVLLLAKGLPSIPITLPQQPTHMGTFKREGGIGMGNTCNSMADSCQCMTKPTAVLWSN